MGGGEGRGGGHENGVAVNQECDWSVMGMAREAGVWGRGGRGEWCACLRDEAGVAGERDGDSGWG